MSLVHCTDTTEAGLRRLLSQYRDKPVLEALLSAYLDQLQLVEDMLFGLQEQRIPMSRDGAITGVQLDVLGRLLGQPRAGRVDVEYMKWLKARILVNRSSGRPDDLLSICVIVLPTETDLLLLDGAEEVGIRILDEVEDMHELAIILRLAKPAGAQFDLWWFQDEDGTFQFTTSGGTETDADRGFGDDTLTDVGGIWAQASSGSR